MRLRGKVFIIKKITGIIKNDFLEILQITPFTSKNTYNILGSQKRQIWFWHGHWQNQIYLSF